MLCKFYLHLNSYVVTVGDGDCYDVSSDVANWQQLKQSYTRKNLGGVVKNYGSKVEFTGRACDLLVELWRSRYVHSRAAFAIHVIDNSWEYHEAWQCPLDFATFSYDGHKVSVNCTEVSAASLIKANGGTRSSYSVDALRSEYRMEFDRILRENVATYKFIGDTPDADVLYTTLDIGVESSHKIYPPFVKTAEEISPESSELDLWEQVAIVAESTNHVKSFFLCCQKACDVTLDFRNLKVWCAANGQSGVRGRVWFELRSSSNVVLYTQPYEEVRLNEYWELECSINETLSLTAGKRVRLLLYTYYYDEDHSAWAKWTYEEGDKLYMNNGEAYIRWSTRGASLNLDVMEPSVLLNRILRTVADGKAYIGGEIVGTVGGVANDRLAGTKILAAESLRGLPGAQVHTSFNQFASFMEAEFGYVYMIERIERVRVSFGGFVDWAVVSTSLVDGSEGTSVNVICFVRDKGMFVGFNGSLGKFVRVFSGYRNYMRLLDVVRDDGSWLEVLESPVYVYSGVSYMYDIDNRALVEYHGEEASVVRFMHRSDLFSDVVVKRLDSISGFSFSVDKSLVYAGVNVGYEKQDYESENVGRDEWNFENYYMTGVELTDAKLELKSPYRADCYGMEELAEKRKEEESTDKDEDVFIVKCLPSLVSGKWKIDRSMTVVGTYTDSVFNAAYSPMFMVEANRGYIASFCDGLKLWMSRGCRDVVIDGDSVDMDFTFSSGERLFRCGKVEVSTDDLELPADMNGLVEFVWNGVRYRGYLESVEQMCQHDESFEYELIEHSVTCIS